MATARIERLMNLVIYLKWTTRYVPAQQIRERVAGYSDSESDEAFSRMFERDKSDLREIGIPIQVGPVSKTYGGEGYRIRADEYAMDPIDLDADEAAAVAIAAAMWRSPELTQSAQSALQKLKAAGEEVDGPGAAAGLASGLDAGSDAEAALTTLLTGITTHRQVRFGHRRDKTKPYADRTLHPWGVVTRNGTFYVVGHDVDRGEVRTFRGSRIGDVRVLDEPAITAPAGFDARRYVAEFAALGYDTQGEARIWLAAGRGRGLRRSAVGAVDETFRDRPGTVVTVPLRSLGTLAGAVAGLGADAVVLEPTELRDAVVASLERLLAGASRTDGLGEDGSGEDSR